MSKGKRLKLKMPKSKGGRIGAFALGCLIAGVSIFAVIFVVNPNAILPPPAIVPTTSFSLSVRDPLENVVIPLYNYVNGGMITMSQMGRVFY